MTSIAERIKAAPIQDVELGRIALDKKNPTRDFGGEFLADVKKHGILQPVILARATATDRFVLVAGHRRVGAATAAGFETVPARVLELDEDEALELQVVENLHRADLHPLDECEQFERLLELVEGGPAEVAARAGVDVARVHQRLALKGLSKKARELFRAGEMELVVALAVARIPDEALREKAAVAVTAVRRDYRHTVGSEVSQRMSPTEALAFIRSHFMLRLVDAPFDRADATLVPAAGACGPCPKRTGGNAQGLFGDLLETKDGTELCTDPKCYGEKVAAGWLVTSAKWAKAGHDVLDAKASEKLFAKHTDSSLDAKSPWADLDEAPNYYTDRTWRQLLGKHVPEKLTVARGRDGKAVWLEKKTVLAKLAKQHKVAIPDSYESGASANRAGASKVSAAEKLKQKRRLFQRKLLAAARPSVFRTIAESAATQKSADAVLRHAIAELEEHAYSRTLQELDGRQHPAKMVAARRGKAKVKLAELAKGMRGLDLVGLLAELVFSRRALMGHEHEWADDAEDLAKDVGADLRGVEEGAKALVEHKYHRMLMSPAERAKDDERLRAEKATKK